MEEMNNLDWDHPHVDKYEEKITLKIPCYEMLHDMMDCLLVEHLGERHVDIHIVGAGGGQELVTLGGRHKDWVFTGVDTSESMLKLARKRLAISSKNIKVKLVQGEVGKLKESKKYSAATCMLVLHFLDMERKKVLLRSIVERLDEGAPFFIATINRDPSSDSFMWQMRAWKNQMLSNGVPIEEWNRFEESIGASIHMHPSLEIESLLQREGFKNITRFFSAYLVDGWFAIKEGGDNKK
ncbi:class I SAM-dependent methyltransferase [Psychrobacillus sp.]|uniref:class I SAM-dependent methyltransferase n=1 Tax=Psychrobacillus sp. TaxID=1871623 RepID=UPI0028BD52B0|nr:class I SAM-dependent methyltransferase [Psychrobacillus sp.]